MKKKNSTTCLLCIVLSALSSLSWKSSDVLQSSAYAFDSDESNTEFEFSIDEESSAISESESSADTNNDGPFLYAVLQSDVVLNGKTYIAHNSINNFYLVFDTIIGYFVNDNFDDEITDDLVYIHTSFKTYTGESIIPMYSIKEKAIHEMFVVRFDDNFNQFYVEKGYLENDT